MKIIFLDIDGVLNTGCNRIKLKEINKGIDDWNYNNIFCRESMKNLKEIVDKTNAKIVLSTTRRFADSLLNPLEIQFMEFGLWNDLIGKTPKLSENFSNGKEKELEINKYVTDNNIESYIILDDDSSLFNSNNINFVQVPWMEGITEEIKNKVIADLMKINGG